MLTYRKQAGFTLVELMIVIVVIAILAAITLVSYRSVQDRAQDAKIRTTLGDAGDALHIEELRGTRPSSVGYWQNTNGVDSVVSPKYLSDDYRDDLKSSNVTAHSRMFRYYRCGDGFALFASLNRPTDDDIRRLQSIKSQCNLTDSSVPETGSNVYNYAKVYQ